MSRNPFEFEAAIRFTSEEMVDYFIDDHNFARLISSERNVFLLGDRGTGKTMMLRYYSLPVQICKMRRENSGSEMKDGLKFAGIYIPCRNPTLAKPEPEMLEPLLARQMSEHFVVVSIINSIADALCCVENLVTESEELEIIEDVRFILQWELQDGVRLFDALKAAAKRESIQAQRELNLRVRDSYYENAATFSGVVLPLLELLTSRVSNLRATHFSLMFDDAEALSDYQNAALNTWIASRDSSRVSFKIATSLVDQKPLSTTRGGVLLERHDFTRIDMEQAFQNTEAGYHKLAQEIVKKRLQKIGLHKSAEEFFPMNQQMEKDLLDAEAEARKDAVLKYPEGTAKQLTDYVYKYSRAYYFRARSSRANRPPYSGFHLIVHVSTGVIRYLLQPCYEMYDAALSKNAGRPQIIDYIEPAIQTERLEELSKRRWDWIKQSFNNSVRDCKREDARHLFQLLDNLAVFFKFRLHNYHSEPRAITFSISGFQSFEKRDELANLLHIARRAQILFRRISSGKDDGRREDYYIFDRLLWIDRGLDPVGQNACASIEAKALWAAAFKNQEIPHLFGSKANKDKKMGFQTEMFSGESE